MLQITVVTTDEASIKTALAVIRSERAAAVAIIKSLDQRSTNLQVQLRNLTPRPDLSKPAPWDVKDGNQSL